MRILMALVVFFSLALVVFPQSSKELDMAATSWSVIEHSSSEVYPHQAKWLPQKFEGPTIALSSRGKSPVLKNFELYPDVFPATMDVVVGPPGSGIDRKNEKGQTRYVEFIKQKAFETDNKLEYHFSVGGRWGLAPSYLTGDYLFEFVTGAENWLDVMVDEHVLGAGKGRVVIGGDSLSLNGQRLIRTSSVGRNNKGVVDVRVYKSYEHFVADPYHKALTESWYSPEKSQSLLWQKPVDAAIRRSPWFPEETPALYKRVYTCRSAAATKGVHFAAAGYITHIWINGRPLDLSNARVPDDYFQVGDNEVLFYSPRTVKGLNFNLDFLALRPYWLKTDVEATRDSVLAAFVRGVASKVYVNGVYAGKLNPESFDEYLGYGLFKEGKNEVCFCLLQDGAKASIERVSIDKVDETKALVLPWKVDAAYLSTKSSGPLSVYKDFYLQWKPGNGVFETTFNGKSATDMEVVFDSGKRFPAWMFRETLLIPQRLLLNGQPVRRTGNSFVLPALSLKEQNTLTFSHQYGSLPEPLLYTSSQAKPGGQFKFKEISRSGRARLKPGHYFVGEKLRFLIEADFSAFEKVTAVFGESSFHLDGASDAELTFELKMAGRQELSFLLSQGEKTVKVPGRVFDVYDFPLNVNKWLKENNTNKEVFIGSEAFYSSETTLFPEAYQQEWVARERQSDSGFLEFGPLSTGQNKKKFSIFDSFPNGVPVMEKFAERLETYLKLSSGAYPVSYIFNKQLDPEAFWKSAATVYQYLRWLEAKGFKVDWSLETLPEFYRRYIEAMPELSAQYMKFRQEKITAFVKKIALNVAPGSLFKELGK